MGSLYTDNSSPFTGGGCISSSLCFNGGAITAFLYPPAAIKHSNKQPSSTSPTSDNLSYDADNVTPIGLRSRDTVWWSNDGKTIQVNGPQVDTMPAGDWRLTHTDNTSIGNFFEFVGANPFDNASTFKAFIPSLKINSDNSSGKLTSINVKFYTQTSTGSFKNVSTTFFETVTWNIFCSYVLKTDNNTSYNFPGSDSNISTSSTEYEFAPTSD